MIDLYKILGVPYDATEGVIRRAYYQKAKVYHPDVYKGADGDAIFKLINEAYHILSDPELRRKYDFKLKYGSTIIFSRAAKQEAEERRERMRQEYIRRKMEDEFLETEEQKAKNRKFSNVLFWVMAGIISHGVLFATLDLIYNGRFEVGLFLLVFLGLAFLVYRKFGKKTKAE